MFNIGRQTVFRLGYKFNLYLFIIFYHVTAFAGKKVTGILLIVTYYFISMRNKEIQRIHFWIFACIKGFTEISKLFDKI